MPFITLVFVLLAALGTFVIAALVVGREAHRLDALSPRVVYVEDQAFEFVSEMLPDDSQSRLTPDELRQLLIFHLRWLNAKGLQPDRVIDRRQDIDEFVVVEEDSVAGFILGEAEREGVEILDDVDVVRVVEAHQAYFDAIGAVGPIANELGD